MRFCTILTRSLICLAVSASALGAGSAPATTTAPAEDIAQMEARLRELKQQAAELETKLSTAKAATRPASDSINTLLAELPKDLWPTTGESSLKVEARAKWFVDNLAGKEIVYRKAIIETAGSAGKGAYIRSKAMPATVIGIKGTLGFYAEFDESEKAGLVQLKTGDNVDLHGTITRVVSSTAAVTVYLNFTTLK